MSQTTATELCPGCAEAINTDDAFCEGCGHRLSAPAAPEALPVPKTAHVPENPPAPETQCAWCPEPVVDGYCVACGMSQPREGDHIETSTRYAAGVCDIGRRYRTNQDFLAVLSAHAGHRPLVAAVVCDGVSSSPNSEVAAQAAARAGAESLVTEFHSDGDGQRATGTALTTAATAAADLANSEDNAPACTYVSAIVAGPEPTTATTDPASATEHTITVGWVGDSRAYWVSAADSVPSAVLTRDHSWAEYMIAGEALSPEEAYAAPHSGALVGWLGADAGEIEGHVVTVPVRGPGALVLCSDGLWNYLPEAEQMATAVPEVTRDPLAAAQSYVHIANEAGGRDNISVIVIPVPLRPTPQGDPPR